MIDIKWSQDGEFWLVTALIADSGGVYPRDYVRLPEITGKGKSRSRNRAVAYALEDLAAQILKEESR